MFLLSLNVVSSEVEIVTKNRKEYVFKTSSLVSELILNTSVKPLDLEIGKYYFLDSEVREYSTYENVVNGEFVDECLHTVRVSRYLLRKSTNRVMQISYEEQLSNEKVGTSEGYDCKNDSNSIDVLSAQYSTLVDDIKYATLDRIRKRDLRILNSKRSVPSDGELRIEKNGYSFAVFLGLENIMSYTRPSQVGYSFFQESLELGIEPKKMNAQEEMELMLLFRNNSTKNTFLSIHYTTQVFGLDLQPYYDFENNETDLEAIKFKNYIQNLFNKKDGYYQEDGEEL